MGKYRIDWLNEDYEDYEPVVQKFKHKKTNSKIKKSKNESRKKYKKDIYEETD